MYRSWKGCEARLSQIMPDLPQLWIKIQQVSIIWLFEFLKPRFRALGAQILDRASTRSLHANLWRKESQRLHSLIIADVNTIIKEMSHWRHLAQAECSRTLAQIHEKGHSQSLVHYDSLVESFGGSAHGDFITKALSNLTWKVVRW